MTNTTEPSQPAPAVRFQLGRVVATPGAHDAIRRAGQAVTDFLSRHQRGDWGDLSPSDAKLNDEAVAHEGHEVRQQRIFSSYRLRSGLTLYCVTEWDRSVTTLLRADEY